MTPRAPRATAAPLPRRMRCGVCGGREWVMRHDRADSWAEKCDRCGGAGSFSFYALGRRIGENRWALQSVDALRAGPKVAARVLDRLSAAGLT